MMAKNAKMVRREKEEEGKRWERWNRVEMRVGAKWSVYNIITIV